MHPCRPEPQPAWGSALLCGRGFWVGSMVVPGSGGGVLCGPGHGLAAQGGALLGWGGSAVCPAAAPSNAGPPPRPMYPAVLAYMQLLEDYSEPQPSVFYQTPQNEHIYQQKNKLLMEVYGFNDSFGTEAPQELAPPPALPPKQRQLVSRPPPRDPLLPGPRGFPRGRSASSAGSPDAPPRGWRRLSLPEQPRAAGPGWCSECLLLC